MDSYTTGSCTPEVLDVNSRTKYSEAFLMSVPLKMADGTTLEDLALSVGGTPASLLQTLRRRHIKIPRRNRYFRDGKVRTFLRVKQSSITATKRKADAMGLTCVELLERLIDVIADDNMFDAVLDDTE